MLIIHLIIVCICILQETLTSTRNNLPNVNQGIQNWENSYMLRLTQKHWETFLLVWSRPRGGGGAGASEWCQRVILILILDIFSDVHLTQSSNLATGAEQCCFTVDFWDAIFAMCNQFHTSVDVGPKKSHVWICDDVTREFGLIWPISTWAGATAYARYVFLPCLGYPDNRKSACPVSGWVKYVSFLLLFHSQYFTPSFITSWLISPPLPSVLTDTLSNHTYPYT